ncbi:MAG: CheR family methyltransferase [Ferrimicrobium sp.]
MPLSDDAYARLIAFLTEELALSLGDGRQYLVESRLASVAVSNGLRTVDEVIFAAVRGRSSPLARQVIDAMVTNETYFFRDPEFFRCLQTSLLRELFERRHGKELTIWSAASSSGQEAYSVAMVVYDRFPNLVRLTRILATDVSEAMVARTKEGWYSRLESERGLEPSLRDRHFVAERGGFRVRPEIRQMVQASVLNLVQPWLRISKVDLVLLRNVLIYFRVSDKRRVIQQLITHLQPGSVVVLGTGETMLGISDCFDLVRSCGGQYYRFRG